jgi:hypothetical protein
MRNAYKVLIEKLQRREKKLKYPAEDVRVSLK